ncbi:hypothetical protein PV326_011870 [Microctonus aethiopoides]|nr:hypothetical protein PV326_011870 [Microctonus aethiopoides]
MPLSVMGYHVHDDDDDDDDVCDVFTYLQLKCFLVNAVQSCTNVVRLDEQRHTSSHVLTQEGKSNSDPQTRTGQRWLGISNTFWTRDRTRNDEFLLVVIRSRS